MLTLARKLAAAALATVALAATAAAQSWPQRAVTLVVTQPAGASPDVMARLLADRLNATLKAGVVVENRAGGANVVGVQAVARAAPDGHTFLFATSAALVSNPYLMKSLPYDPVKDLAPVAFITRSSQLLVANPGIGARTLPELIALDKKAPGKLSIGVDGPRNLAGITALALNKRAGTRFVPVPYPNPPAGLQDIVAGRVELGVFSISIAEALVREGKLAAIAAASLARPVALPQVPAVAETIPGFDFSGWFMVMAPAGTPREIVVGMNSALEAAAKDEKVRTTAARIGFEMDAKGLGSPEDAARFLKEQLALWERTTKELGIEAQ